jgi:hypothetical protein
MSKKLKLLCSLWFLVCASLSAALTDAWPQMVRADQSATITMVFENEPLLEKPERLALLYLNDDGLRSDGQPFQYGVRETIPFVIEGNTIKATLRFPGETIHTLTLVDTNNKKETPVAVFKIYYLKPDFFALRPFKGNFHMHSQFSDGAEKTGSIMVATCRKFGQDFASESDHNAYAGSEEAMAFFHHVPTDMKAYPGEEVHSQGNSVHILSVGSSESMADWFKNSGRPLVVVANKLDKLKKSEIEPNLALIRETLTLPEEVLIIPFSAEKGQGREALMAEIVKLL